MYKEICRNMARGLVLLLCLMICFPGRMALAEGAAYQAKNGETIRRLIGGEDKAYILTSQRVVELTYRDGVPAQRELAGNPRDVSFLCQTSGGLIGITAQNDCYLLNGDAWNKVDLASGDPGLMELGLSVFAAAALGDDIYEWVYDPGTDASRCLLLRPMAGTLREVPDLHSADTAAAWRQGQLLFTAYDENGNEWLYAYDTGAGTISPLALDNAPGSFAALWYDPENDTLYVAGPEDIVASASGGAFQRVSPLKDANGLAGLGSNVLAVLSGGSVYAWDRNERSSTPSLTVMNVFSRFDTAFTAGTGVALTSFSTPGDMSVMEHMSYALASRDGTVDIYGFATRDGLKTIGEKGMFTDLGQSAVLAQNAQSLYPALYEAVVYEGQLAAWPMNVQSFLHVQETGILDRYGLSSPETFDGLMDLIPRLAEGDMLADNGLCVFDTMACTKEGLLKYFTRQYLLALKKDGVRLTFDMDLFRHMAGRILSEAPDTDPVPLKTGEESPLFTLAAVAGGISEDMRPPFRLSENDPAIETLVQVAVVNPFSPRREEAIRYLEFCARQRDEQSYFYYADMREPWPDHYAQDELYRLNQALDREKSRQVKPEEEKARQEEIARLQADIARNEERKYAVTPEAIAHYHRLAERFVVSGDSLLSYGSIGIDSFIDQLLAGRYGLEGFITAVDARIRQVYAENGM